MGSHKKHEVSPAGVQNGHPESCIRAGNGKSARKTALAGILPHCDDYGRIYEQTAESVKVMPAPKPTGNSQPPMPESGSDDSIKTNVIM